jgi:hypothetical protein
VRRGAGRGREEGRPTAVGVLVEAAVSMLVDAAMAVLVGPGRNGDRRRWGCWLLRVVARAPAELVEAALVEAVVLMLMEAAVGRSSGQRARATGGGGGSGLRESSGRERDGGIFCSVNAGSAGRVGCASWAGFPRRFAGRTQLG